MSEQPCSNPYLMPRWILLPLSLHAACRLPKPRNSNPRRSAGSCSESSTIKLCSALLESTLATSTCELQGWNPCSWNHVLRLDSKSGIQLRRNESHTWKSRFRGGWHPAAGTINFKLRSQAASFKTHLLSICIPPEIMKDSAQKLSGPSCKNKKGRLEKLQYWVRLWRNLCTTSTLFTTTQNDKTISVQLSRVAALIWRELGKAAKIYDCRHTGIRLTGGEESMGSGKLVTIHFQNLIGFLGNR